MLGQDVMSSQDAERLIMKARAHWFEGEDGEGDASAEAAA
jgi:hypothetical protein